MNLIKKIKKASDVWSLKRNTADFVAILVEEKNNIQHAERTHYAMISERTKKIAMKKLMETLKIELSNYELLQQSPWLKLKHSDWETVLQYVKKHHEFFKKAIIWALPRIKKFCQVDRSDFYAKEIWPNTCDGDDCWYEAHPGRHDERTLHEDIVSERVFCNLCRDDDPDYSDEVIDEFTDKFIEFLKQSSI